MNETIQKLKEMGKACQVEAEKYKDNDSALYEWYNGKAAGFFNSAMIVRSMGGK